MDISVVIPVYGCPEAVGELHRRLCETLDKLVSSYEIIMVDDHCPKDSWSEIRKVCEKDKRVIGIHFTRNFGQIYAIAAGLQQSRGDWVVVMDCDLQDRPEGIEELYQKAREGYDIVLTRRMARQDSRIVKFFSHMFYKVYNHFSDMEYDFRIGNFSIASRRVVDAFCAMRERNRDYIMGIMWLGYKRTAIDLVAEERYAGKSSYNFRRKLNLAIDMITAQSNKPLLIAVKLGMVFAGFSLLYILYLVLRMAIVGDFPEGWATLVASLYLIGGLVLSALGVVGIYVGNVFNEAKARPLYVIEEMLNGEKGNE